MPEKLFDLGPVCITLGAMLALIDMETPLLPMIDSYHSGAWGVMDKHDKKVNDAAVY